MWGTYFIFILKRFQSDDYSSLKYLATISLRLILYMKMEMITYRRILLNQELPKWTFITKISSLLSPSFLHPLPQIARKHHITNISTPLRTQHIENLSHSRLTIPPVTFIPLFEKKNYNTSNLEKHTPTK